MRTPILKALLSPSAIGLLANISSTLSIFAVFHVVFSTQAPEILGAWALIQAAFVIARLPETGFNIVATRLAAIHLAKPKQFQRAWSIATATMLVNVCSTMTLAIAIVPVLQYSIRQSDGTSPIQGEIYTAILIALPVAIIQSALVGMQSLMDGLGAIRARSTITLFVSPALPLLSYLLVPIYGLVGLAIANLILAALMFVLTLIVYQNICGTGVLSTRLIRSMIRTNIRQGTFFSLSSSLRAGFEPLTKYMVGSAAGLGEVAILEIALRGSTQIRFMIQGLLQPLLPKVPNLTQSSKSNLLTAYFDLAVWATLLAYCTLIVASPLLSHLFVGHLNYSLIVYIAVLSGGNILNCIGMLGYFLEIGQNQSRGVVRITCTMFAINAVGGALGAWFDSPLQVISAYASAFGVAGLWGYRKYRNYIGGYTTLPATGIALCAGAAAYIWLAVVVSTKPDVSLAIQVAFALISFSVISSLAVKSWVALRSVAEGKAS